MKTFKDLILFKPNQLIEITGAPLTNQGILAYDFILHKLQQENTDNIIISATEIMDAINGNRNFQDLYLYLDSLQKIRIESKDSKGKLWGAFNLLSEYKKLENGIFVAIPPSIYKALETKEKTKDSLYYTTIKLLEKRIFKCLYSLIFYDFFKKYENINIPTLTVENIRQITGTIEKYKEYKIFKAHVLKKALIEINKFETKFEYSFEEKKIGRKVNEIKFIRTEKGIDDVTPENKISEKLLKAIEKARKNRYINESYSQKAMEKIFQKYEEKDIIKALKELYKYNSEIKSFSKILTAKIEDIKNSKMDKIKENQGHILGQEKIETAFKNNFTEPKKSDLDIEKEKISNLIRNSDLPTNKRMNLWSELAKIQNLKDKGEIKYE
ncbi:Initiator Replication protein [Prosthecobacter debontii]|uniref:Initiator Replication protein n=1 Tax=Prosthecobacter debontii TaxID=48467 RepID=A0A1T4Z6C0_9BACT|nr:replication initiation protein [Prosthecobacter debontii]SKB09496.1 Initiator Replication protein [Prosthecobacter debontii]